MINSHIWNLYMFIEECWTRLYVIWWLFR